MKTAIAVEHLTVRLGKSFDALQDVSVEIKQGKITGFIGPSGAGKTTLIRAIVGRQKISAGKVTLLGQPAGSASLRDKVRYMTQDLSVYGDLTAGENLRYFARMTGYGGRAAKSHADKALTAVRLSDKASVLVSSLSGGQKQRVSLAIALIGEAELLMLDEPTVGLDPVLREQLWELFRELRDQGKTIVVTSHVMDEAGRCDELVLLRNSQVIAAGSPDELCKRTGSQTVEQSFLKLAGGLNE